jgi:hypothetical protein
MEILKLLKTFVKGGIVVFLPFVFSVIMSLLCFLSVSLVMWIEGNSFYASFLTASQETGVYVIWFTLGILIMFWHFFKD